MPTGNKEMAPLPYLSLCLSLCLSISQSHSQFSLFIFLIGVDCLDGLTKTNQTNHHHSFNFILAISYPNSSGVNPELTGSLG